MKPAGSLVLAMALAACSGETKTVTKTNTLTNTVTNTNTNTNTVTVPGDVQCDGDLCVVSGTITDDTTFTSDKQWLLRGGVFIGNDVDETVLTIEPGTTVYGENATGGMLVVRRGSKILAEGTAAEPIVMTSSKNPGSRARGDWGGLVINGRAPINNCADDGASVCEQFGEGGTGFFGGDDPNDDSGVLRYVRVEFAGTLISPDNELNGIGFQAVGRATDIEYVQVHMNADDGIEFFGGTAEWKHVVVTGVGDDSLDWTDGWTGKGQFFVAQQYEDSGDNGIEADNNGENNDATPRSKPVLSNLTLIGSPDSSASDFGALLREGTAGELHASVFTGFNAACLSMAQAATLNQVQSGDLTMASSLVDCATAFETDDDNGEITTPDIAAFFAAGAGNIEDAADLADPFDARAPDFTPAAGSAAATGGVTPGDAFFDAVSFRGGVDPSDDWTAGWTTSDPN
jgi:hypothetical protein